MLLQILEIDTPASTGGALCPPPDNKICRPIHLRVDDVPHSGDVGCKTGIVILLCVNEYPVIAVLAQRQQAMDHTISAEHTVQVLPYKRMIRQGDDFQPTKIIMGQLYHLFNLAVVHLKITRLFHKICFEFHSTFPPLRLWQITAWIDEGAVDPHLQVQMRAGGVAGGTYQTDYLSHVHDIPHLDQTLRLMGIGSGHSVSVVNDGIVAKGAGSTAFGHRT